MEDVKIKLFGTRIEPACQYCEYGKFSRDMQMVHCTKRGTVAPYFSCRSYRYAPLRRIPKREAPLPQYSHKDFEL